MGFDWVVVSIEVVVFGWCWCGVSEVMRGVCAMILDERYETSDVSTLRRYSTILLILRM